MRIVEGASSIRCAWERMPLQSLSPEQLRAPVQVVTADVPGRCHVDDSGTLQLGGVPVPFQL